MLISLKIMSFLGVIISKIYIAQYPPDKVLKVHEKKKTKTKQQREEGKFQLVFKSVHGLTILTV